MVLLILTVVFCASMFQFGYQFPLWQWRIFKAKYISPIALWVAYCAALPFSIPRRISSDLVLLALVVFMFTNHLLPVY